MVEKVFKVFKNINNFLFSANANFQQEYFLNQINKPIIPNSKLFCFNDSSAAFNFITEEPIGSAVVYECLADGVISCPSRIPIASQPENLLFKSWKLFNKWNNANYQNLLDADTGDNVIDRYEVDARKRIQMRSVPKNSLLCDSLYILKKIE